jgi:hypothetical protein
MELVDTPENVIINHLIRENLCSVKNRNNNFLIRPKFISDELQGYGNPSILADLLFSEKEFWSCVEVDIETAKPLGKALSKVYSISYIRDIHYVLNKKLEIIKDSPAILLCVEHIPLIEQASESLKPEAFRTLKELLLKGCAAAVIKENRIVSLAFTSALTEKYADIGVNTDENYRRKGYATACANLVCYHIQQSGKIPIWSCGESNIASNRTTKRLGFVKINERIYVIVK